jgi:PAS domain S-box-containing protein
MFRELEGTERHRLLPIVDDSANRRLLREWVSDHTDYELVNPADDLLDLEFDCVIVDGQGLLDKQEALERRQSRERIVLPSLLLVPESRVRAEKERLRTRNPSAWNLVDDVLEVPIRKSRLEERVETLLRLRQQSRDALEQQQQLRRFKRASEAAGHAIYITDSDGVIEYLNPAFEAITGYSPEDAIGKTPRILNSGEMPDGYFDRLWESVLSGEVWNEEVVNRRKDGELYHAHQTIAPIVDEAGDVEAFVAIQTDISDRKTQERRLQRYRQAIERSTNLIGCTRRDGTIIFANRAFRDFFGIDEDALPGIAIDDVLDGEGVERFNSRGKQVLQGDVLEYTESRTSVDGVERTFHIQNYPIPEGDGTVSCGVTVMRDVTEERERMAEVRQLSEYRRVMSEVNQLLVRADGPRSMFPKVADLIASSDRFECTFVVLFDELDPEFVCHRNSELTADSVAEFHTDRYLEAVFETDVLHVDDVTEPPFEQHVAERPSHPGLAIEVSHENESYGVLTVHFPPEQEVLDSDVSLIEELAADLGFFLHNQEIERELETFEEIAERIDDPVMLQDLDGRFQVVNAALAEYAGSSKEALVGQDEFAFMDAPTARTIREMKERALSDERAVEYEVSPELPGTDSRSFSTLRYPHYDEDGELDGTVAICRDVTDLKERERQLRVIDRVLRHNLHNDMNVIKGIAQTIVSSTDGAIASHARTIVDTSDELLDTVDKEREITNYLSRNHRTERVEMVSVLGTVVERMDTRYPNVDISLEAPDEAVARASKHVHKAITEVVENAIIHSDRERTTIEVSVVENGACVGVRIEDDGPGIPEMERNVLTGEEEVDPLYHGSGLGLWLVNLLVKGSDGTLEFETNEPRGSVVTIELPAA